MFTVDVRKSPWNDYFSDISPIEFLYIITRSFDLGPHELQHVMNIIMMPIMEAHHE